MVIQMLSISLTVELPVSEMRAPRAAVWYLTVAHFFVSMKASPIMGPADIKIKFGGHCGLAIPTLIDYNIRMIQQRGKMNVKMNATLPWPFGDDFGVFINVAIKRDGAWKPNFLQLKGDKICSGLKLAQYEVFKDIAKTLKAPDPPACPLPAGFVSIDMSPDIRALQEKTHIGILPYGELKLSVNVTRKHDTIVCMKCLVDVVPKKATKG